MPAFDNYDDTALRTECDAAAAYFLHRYPNRCLTRPQVADAIRLLIDAGYVVSPSEHNRVCAQYADRLRQCEAAADELLAQISRTE